MLTCAILNFLSTSSSLTSSLLAVYLLLFFDGILFRFSFLALYFPNFVFVVLMVRVGKI